MADKAEANEDVAEKLQELEDVYTNAANIEVVDPSQDANTRDALKEVFGDDANTNVASVSGAGLNVAPDRVAKLDVQPTADEKSVGDGFNSVAQVDMKLLEGDSAATATNEVKNIVAPIIITLPLPKNILKSKLFVLHFYADGTYELIKPVLTNNSMIITVSHFSTFAIVELADGQAINNGGGNGNEGNGGNGNNNNGNDGNVNNNNPGNDGNVVNNTGDDNGSNNAGNENGDANNANATNNGAENVVPGNGENEGAGNTTGDNNNAGETQDTSAPVGTKVSTKNGNYVVTKSFEVAFKSPLNKKVKSVKIDSTVTIDGKKYKVTSIYNNAFKNCKKLKSVTISKNVVTIGKNAFAGCKELKSVTIPSNVTKIGSNAFNGCSKLNKITIKSTKITSIGKNAFKGIKKGAVIKVPKSKKKEYKKLFKKAKLPDSVKIK